MTKNSCGVTTERANHLRGHADLDQACIGSGDRRP